MSRKQFHVTKAVLALRPDSQATPAYRIHQHVADLLGQTDDRGYLYRVLRERPGGVELLIYSEREPLPLESVPVRPTGALVSAESKKVDIALASGQELDFEIRLNATTSVAGRRLDAWDARDREINPDMVTVYGEYLRRKLEHAAEVLDVAVLERGRLHAARRGNAGKGAQMVAVNVRGRLRVRSGEALLELLASGIGRGKAFGCGLLCLSRPGTVLPQKVL